MKTILRNFLTTLRRFKMANILNILGLSSAFAAFFIIMTQVYFERTFDTCYKDQGQLYRVAVGWDSTYASPLMARPVMEAITGGIPQLEKVTLTNLYSYESYISIDRGGEKIGFKELCKNADKKYPEVFGFEFIDGNLEAYQKPGAVLVPESIAGKLFGTSAAAGRMIFFNGDSTNHEIAGVYRDFPANSCMDNPIMIQIDENENKNSWGNGNYYCYAVLSPGTNAEEIAKTMGAQMAKMELPEWMSDQKGKGILVYLTPIEDIYYLDGQGYDAAPKGNKTTTDILFLIAILVVVIAAINFVNFATSLTPIRIKSINTQKVLGSQVSTLRAALVFEAVGIAIVAYLLSLLWIYIIGRTGISSIFMSDIDLSANVNIAVITFALALITGVISGLYPAIYTTSFPPALVLKGSFGMSPTGRRLRTILIGFQFVVSIGLIIAAIFLQLQSIYVRNYDSGMDTEQIAMVELDDNLSGNKKDALVNRLKSNPLVEDVAFAQFKFGSSDLYMSWGRNFRGEESIQFWCMPVSYNFPEVMGIKFTDGRSFTQNDEQKDYGTFIFNDAAKKKYKLTLEDKVQGHRDTETDIVGFTEDFNFMSLRKAVEPVALYQFGNSPWAPLPNTYIKIKGNPFQAVDHIKKSIAEIDPVFPVEVDFFDTMFDEVYKKEERTSSLITFFSALAVIISLVGVFGLVVFETQFRRKEIGVRKVHGATVGEILIMFNNSFVRIVLVCFVVAAPLAWYGVSRWLETFAFKTPIYWWVFAVALIVVMVITLITVTIQSWKAATENPVKSIKSE